MTRALAVAALALSMAACSSSNSDGMKSEADSSGAHAHILNDDASDTDAQPLNGADVARHKGVSDQDRQFVANASQGGLYEVQAGQLALQKTQDAHVRMIAEHMIHDHTQANQQLEQVAQHVGLSVQSQPSNQQQQMISELNGLNGTDFDQRYIQQQTKAHQETIALFQQEQSDGRNGSLRIFAGQTLPTLQEHLRMITGNNNNISNEQQ